MLYKKLAPEMTLNLYISQYNVLWYFCSVIT